MKRAGDVLERNLELLLRRAYAPALPRESFRARLERDFLARAARFARDAPAGAGVSSARVSSGAPGPRRLGRWTLPLAAAAALAAFLFSGPWTSSPAVESLGALLARGVAAERRSPAGEWRAVAGALEHDGAFLELVTPADVRARVSSAALTLELHGASHLWMEDGGAAELRAGGVSLERPEGASPFLLATSEGQVGLVAGRVRVAHEPPADPRAEGDSWVRVVVRSGESFVGDGRLVLGPGREVFLRAGRVLDPSTPPGPAVSAAPPGRSSVAPGLPEVEPAIEPSSVQVFGEVVLSGERPVPVEDFQVVVLREASLPQVAAPEVFPFLGAGGRFELGGLRAGRHEVFVRGPGRALWRSGPLQVGAPGEPAVGPVSAVLEEGVTVRGLVLDGETGLPIPGAVVLSETDAPVQVLELDTQAERDNVPEEVLALAATRTDGGFEIADLSRGLQVFRAWAPGYGPTWIGPIEVGPGPLELEFELDVGARLEGVVLDGNGRPIVGGFLVASITDFGPGHPIMSYRSALTDGEGHYEMDGLPEGHWTLLSFGPLAAGVFEPDLDFVQVFSGETTRHDFRPVADGVRMAGRLVDAGGRPVVQRSLWVIPASARGSESMSSTSSGADGGFSFPSLAPDRYVVFVSGLEPADVTVLGRVDLADGLDRTDLVFTLEGGSISGRVLDGVSAEPIHAAAVLLLREGATAEDEFAGRAVTAVDGRFAFEGVRSGRYRITVFSTQMPYGHSGIDHLEVGPGEAVTDLVVHLQPGGSLELRVGTREGDPIRGARVWTRSAQGSEVVQLVEYPFTDAGGRLTMPAMDAGRWTLVIEAEGFLRTVREVPVPVSREPVQVEVVLERAP